MRRLTSGGINGLLSSLASGVCLESEAESRIAKRFSSIHAKMENDFRCRDLNPGRSDESRVS